VERATATRQTADGAQADLDAYFGKLNQYEYEGGDRNAMGPDSANSRNVIALGDLIFRH
jgi:hypothetical protein